MTKRVLASLTLLAATLQMPASAAATCSPSSPAAATVTSSAVTLTNGCVTRVWAPGALRTVSLTDERTGVTLGGQFDFRLIVNSLNVASETLPIADIQTAHEDGAATITWTLLLPDVAEVTRAVTLYPGIAGFAIDTSIRALAPLALSGYTLDEVLVGPATPTVHEFRAGADWRDPNYNPPGIGPNHAGDWREGHTAPYGQTLIETGEWTSAALPDGEQIAIVNERRDYASSIGSYDMGVVSAGVDLSRDVVYLGPFEESGHIENPGPGPARHRVVDPRGPLQLERAFTVVARDADDEAWQWYRYLEEHRRPSYLRRVMFNSDQVDRNAISTGAKDDMSFDRFKAILPAVREMGSDTFIFDDGWMARAGDWCPDSPTCLEPRNAQNPVKYAPRFPDDTFAAVQQYLKDDPRTPEDDVDLDLGLWMNPMSYHPSSAAFQTNPQWSCAPVGTGTGVVTAADPDSSSNEAGIGLWNPRAMGVHPDDPTKPIRMIDYLEERIRRAIDTYGAKIFKFDFLVWVDCAGPDAVTMYEYRDEFVNMLDRIQADHQDVTFQIDDTNDHRMWPFETVARGTSWYLNGGPSMSHALHTVWLNSPYIPGSTQGMRSLNSGIRNAVGVDSAMAAAITTHLTFSFAVDEDLTAAQRAQTAKWVGFYKANRDAIGGFAYPLLSDPATKSWTALQPWDRDAQSGWLMAYRLESTSETQTIPLRGIDGTSYRVTKVDPATNSSTDLGTFTGTELRAGLDVTIAGVNGYALYKVEQV